jgi:hypothetical protein
MVLIRLLLPTNGPAPVDGMAPLAETRRELAETIQRRDGVPAIARDGIVDRA